MTDPTTAFPFRRIRRALSCVLLGASLMATAVAQPLGEGRMHRGSMSEMRAMRQAERAQQRAAQRGMQNREAPIPRSPERELQGPPTGQGLQVPDAAPPRPGRLTPEERRALRQQINEAGRDVYRPIRP